eukprot:356465-Chlamydomonas_euryale.AAC.1
MLLPTAVKTISANCNESAESPCILRGSLKEVQSLVCLPTAFQAIGRIAMHPSGLLRKDLTWSCRVACDLTDAGRCGWLLLHA